jgi:hypothetical protein
VLKTSKSTKNANLTVATVKRRYGLFAPIIIKRSLLASVFVSLLACQAEKEDSELNSSTDPQSGSYQSNSLPPLLTLDELLNADDFQTGIKQAVINNDADSLQDWQTQLLAVAQEVRLSQRDLNRISGTQGLVFIEFEAKKQLFHDEFVERFMHFEEIDDLIEKYPYLTGVHQRAISLIRERDQAIERAAKLLAEDGLKGDAIAEARAQWSDYMQNSGKLDSLRN